jgi:hypothetical protein
MVSIKKGTPSLSYSIMAAPSRSLLALRICSIVFTTTAAQVANVPSLSSLFLYSKADMQIMESFYGNGI